MNLARFRIVCCRAGALHTADRHLEALRGQKESHTMARENANGTITMYTTAPRDYDYSYTQEIESSTGHSGHRTWRRVEIDAGWQRTQCSRYGSGLHAVVDCTEFAKRIDTGLVTIH